MRSHNPDLNLPTHLSRERLVVVGSQFAGFYFRLYAQSLNCLVVIVAKTTPATASLDVGFDAQAADRPVVIGHSDPACLNAALDSPGSRDALVVVRAVAWPCGGCAGLDVQLDSHDFLSLFPKLIWQLISAFIPIRDFGKNISLED
jgi:hypothetical protein